MNHKIEFDYLNYREDSAVHRRTKENVKYFLIPHIRKTGLLFLSLLLFSLTPVAFAQQSNSNRIRDAKIAVKSKTAPIIRVRNYSNTVNIGPKWVTVNLEYIPFSNQKTNPVFFNFNDSFDIKFEVIIIRPNFKSVFLLSNTTSYWPISFDEKKHYAVAFIPFRIIEKITPQKRDRLFFKEMIKVRATFYFNGRVIGQTYYPQTEESAKIFTATSGSSPEVVRIPGGLFKRSQTPWAMLNPDKYELSKQ